MRIFLTILFVIVCIALSVVVLLQEGKSGLGALTGGSSETYWGKNKGRSAEGILAKVTKILAVVFMLLALLLNMNLF
ncbi:MAG: preprotein translocase subunit SecG [Lachnospiraceae bacterium]|nr:preprotein translocase subunit SecG [Lachnospiraceae bacterium]MEE1014500.1 preprotein translocase subunit SecG [Lachnospiraceae bacterium]